MQLTFPKGYGLGYGVKVSKASLSFKPPMLVVGANNYLRDMVNKFGIDTNWELTLLFFPTPDATWRVGVLGVSKVGTEAFLNWSEADTVDEAIRSAMCADKTPVELREHATLWLQLSIYRCPKISLKDILALEPYRKTA